MEIAPTHHEHEHEHEHEEEDQLAFEQRLYEESLRVLDEGQVLIGTIVQKDKDELLVDVGGKSEGVLPFRELSLILDGKLMKVGDTLEVMVHRIDELDGTLFLSERRARALKTWEKVIESHEHDQVIEATVTQVVKGGVLVDLGMRGFVPASQIRRQPIGNLDELINQKLRLKVIDLDHKRHRVVLSQRLVLEEEMQAKKQELMDTMEVGQIREGTVVRLADFGAFVDLGGIDGLIHNSELAYSRVKHPSEVVKIGDAVNVEIMKFDAEAKKVSLSLKHALPDPWDEHADKLYETNKLKAQVVKVTPNYLLVELVPGILAMVPKGEFDGNRQYVVAQDVEVTILTVNHQTRRITVSIQHVADVPLEEIEKFVVEDEDIAPIIPAPVIEAEIEHAHAHAGHTHEPEAHAEHTHEPEAHAEHTPESEAHAEHTPEPEAHAEHTPEPEAHAEHTPEPEAHAEHTPEPEAHAEHTPESEAHAEHTPEPEAHAEHTHEPEAHAEHTHEAETRVE